MSSSRARRAGRIRRHARVRRRVTGTPDRPRLSVYRSARNIWVQLIDDAAGNTLVACSTLSADVKQGLESGANIAAAEVVGRTIGEKAVATGVHRAVFDRGGYRYHGRVQAVAEAARKAGLDLGETRAPKNKGKSAEVAEAKGKGKGKGESKKSKKKSA